MQKINWDDYFMSLCFHIAQKSLDQETKHGSIAVDEEHSILATGYNSPPRGSLDEEMPLTRPDKYPFMVHSEEALICNAARNGIKLKNSKLYVSGEPCHLCLRKIINVGFSEVIYGPLKTVSMDDKDMRVKELMMKGRMGLVIRPYVRANIKEIALQNIKYLDQKIIK